MKIEVILSPCPWCKKTPDMKMPTNPGSTWCWSVKCNNSSCGMQPESPYMPIRNTSQTILPRFLNKLEELALKWNRNNPYQPFEKKVIDLSPIEKNFTK